MSHIHQGGLLLLFLQFLAVCNAQTNRIFQWKFTSSVSASLPSCQELPITIQPFNPQNVTGSRGVAPYYMVSFAVGGLPKTDLIGADLASLKWTVNHPINTEMMLSVIDSTGSAGGIPPQLYTVVTGQSTSCIQTPPANVKTDFTVTSNFTGPLNTCQPWGLRIKGGVPPYSVTLAALSSPVVTNVTLSPVDDAFTYINRADPNTKLLAAISDFTGRWAFGTPIVPTQGSTDINCPGLNSLGDTTANLERQAQQAAAAQAAAASKKRASIIAGVVVPIILLLLLAAGAWYFFVFRKRQQEGDAEKGVVDPFSTPTGSIPPVPVDHTPGQVLSINSFIDGPQSPKSISQSTSLSRNTTSSIPYASEPGSRPLSSRTASTSSGGRPGFASFPRASTRASQKAIEAGMEPHEPTDGAEIVIQHQDGGAVRELPPPYMNPTTPRP